MFAKEIFGKVIKICDRIKIIFSDDLCYVDDTGDGMMMVALLDG